MCVYIYIYRIYYTRVYRGGQVFFSRVAFLDRNSTRARARVCQYIYVYVLIHPKGGPGGLGYDEIPFLNNIAGPEARARGTSCFAGNLSTADVVNTYTHKGFRVRAYINYIRRTHARMLIKYFIQKDPTFFFFLRI